MDRALRDWTTARIERLAADPARGRAGPVALLSSRALAVEASHRRFYRVRWQPTDGPAASAVVMSSPPELENNDQFVVLAGVFADHGIGVPRLLASDRANGWFLMTDLGDVHFADVYQREGPDAVLPAALDTLHRLQAVQDPRIPVYTRGRFEDELEIYREWFLSALLDVSAPAALDEACDILVAATQRQPVCCVHRDFHSRNLLRCEAPDIGVSGVGVVDFQDALMGPATYDLASLLRDCYHRFPEPAVARWRDAYLAATPLPVDRAGFARDLDLTALQRQLKAVGIFARLHLRDHRDSHLPHIVPVLERIAALAAGYAELHGLAAHVDALLPATGRRLGSRA
ncbi:MAG: phosphotransferase [Pseudomonadales bacterium]